MREGSFIDLQNENYVPVCTVPLSLRKGGILELAQMWISNSPHVLDNLAIFTTFQFGRTGMFNVLESAKLTGPSTSRKLTSHVYNVAGE